MSHHGRGGAPSAPARDLILRDKGKPSSFSRRDFCARVFGKPRHQTFCLRKNKGRRNAERRGGRDPYRKFARERAIRLPVRRAPRMFRVTADIRLRGALAFRRSAATLARLYAWLSFGLRL